MNHDPWEPFRYWQELMRQALLLQQHGMLLWGDAYRKVGWQFLPVR